MVFAQSCTNTVQCVQPTTFIAIFFSKTCFLRRWLPIFIKLSDKFDDSVANNSIAKKRQRKRIQRAFSRSINHETMRDLEQHFQHKSLRDEPRSVVAATSKIDYYSFSSLGNFQ